MKHWRTVALATALLGATPEPYPPPVVLAALEAQASQAPAQRVEACTPGGIAAAGNDAQDDLAKGNWVHLASAQNDYSIGFARCALGAQSIDDFITFSCATSKTLANALYGARQLLPKIDSSEKTVAARAKTIAAWILDDPNPANEQKDGQVSVLNMLTNIGF